MFSRRVHTWWQGESCGDRGKDPRRESPKAPSDRAVSGHSGQADALERGLMTHSGQGMQTEGQGGHISRGPVYVQGGASYLIVRNVGEESSGVKISRAFFSLAPPGQGGGGGHASPGGGEFFGFGLRTEAFHPVRFSR